MTSRVLTIDTTSDFGSLAIAENGRVIDELLIHSTSGFGHLLFPQIQLLLDRHGWRLDSIDCFAAASGPGSFTGVRVGVAAVKGLAETLGKKAMGVSNLRALAAVGSRAYRAVFFDARRGEIYGAVYSAEGNLVQQEVVRKFPEWLAALPDGDLELVTPEPGAFAEAIAASKWNAAPVIESPRALAAVVARIAASQEGSDPVGIDANYVRRTDAQLFWADR